MQNKKIVKNTTMLYAMNIAKMIFPLITLPYLTRVLSVPGYGMVVYVKAIMQYMQLIVDFGFLLSGTKDIVLAGTNQDKINKEVGNIFVAKLMLSVVAFLGLCCIIPFITILKENILFVILSYIVVFLTCFLMDFFFRGIEKMEVITIRFVIMRGIATLLTFFVVKDDSDLLWIPVLDIAGTIVAIVLVWYELKKNEVKIKPEGIRPVLAKIKESAIYFFSDMATTAFNALNTVLIGIYLDAVGVAFWGVCMQLIGAAQSLYTPITNGIYPHMVRTRDASLLKKTMIRFMPVVILGCIFTLFVAKYAIVIIAGSKYVGASSTLKLLIPVLLFSFPSMLYGWPALGAIGRQKETTITTVTSACFQVALLIVLITTNHFNLVTISIARGCTELVLFSLRFFLCKKYKSDFSISKAAVE